MFALRILCVMLLVLACTGVDSAAAAPATVTTYKITPSATDPAIHQDDSRDWVMFDREQPVGAPLVVFMPGTHGKPGNRDEMALMHLIIAQGYRLAWISFDNDVSVSKICPHAPDPHCSTKFRRMRVDGIGPGPVDNPVGESVVSRLTHLLSWLQAQHPGEGWGLYLDHGQPAWQRIVVSGHSTGAGMAAYIAKTREVARVVLFSSPWDDVHPQGMPRQTAPWLALPSATPMDRWYAEYNQHEDTAPLIAAAYKALKIPPGHILVFNLALPEGYANRPHHNPYHLIVIRDARYAPAWKKMFGKVEMVAPTK